MDYEGLIWEADRRLHKFSIREIITLHRRELISVIWMRAKELLPRSEVFVRVGIYSLDCRPLVRSVEAVLCQVYTLKDVCDRLSHYIFSHGGDSLAHYISSRSGAHTRTTKWINIWEELFEGINRKKR